MGIIIELPRERSESRSAPATSAEIVIFPGVQMERREFTLADRISPQRQRRQPAQSQAIEIDKG
jgi:hypothetical protein